MLIATVNFDVVDNLLYILETSIYYLTSIMDPPLDPDSKTGYIWLIFAMHKITYVFTLLTHKG